MAFWNRNKGAAGKTPSLVILSYGGREGLLPKFSYPLGAEPQVIGRDEGCSIQILDPKISRRQVAIEYDETLEGHVAADMESANGTFINGIKITRRTKLHEGDIIEIGNSKLTFTTEKFKDHDSAMAHFKRAGERFRGTMQMDMQDP